MYTQFHKQHITQWTQRRGWPLIGGEETGFSASVHTIIPGIRPWMIWWSVEGKVHVNILNALGNSDKVAG